MDFPPVPLPIKRRIEFSASRRHADRRGVSQLTLCKVTALQHESRDDTVERAPFVSKSVLASREFTEVPGGFGDNVIVELEDDATSVLVVDGDIKLVAKDTDRKIGM